MSLLPTAHAGQSFGSRRIDFFTVSGEVSSSEAGTGRVTDGDGVVHDVRLAERSSAFAKGDTATVLRVQSGPNRRSRPVAIINHSRDLWMRAAPDATALLARSGVTRTLNWWLSFLGLALVAIAVAWPNLHVFLTELNGAMMAGVPAFNIYNELGAPLPGLASWRLETALSPGLFDGIAALGLVPMEQLTEWGMAAAATVLGLITFFARSWRLVYVPALAVLCVFAGAILGNPVVSLAMIGGALLLFIIGGFINRVRDGGRFNARVERLAEYILRHPPEEGVRTSEPARAGAIAPEPLAAAAAATAIAAASAVAEGDEQDDVPQTPVAEGDEPVEAEAASGTEDPGQDNAPQTGMATPAEPAQSGTNGEVAAEIAAGDDSADHDAAPAGAQEVQADADDDLPSLEAVAAAAALSNTERDGPGETPAAAAPVALDDERTMAVAAPPPMPAAPGAASPAAFVAPEADQPPLPVAAEIDEPEDEAVTADGAAPAEPAASTPEIDDPMIEDDHDPMVDNISNDFAPGAPDVEVDREPAQ